jgi:hypothetical protein
MAFECNECDIGPAMLAWLDGQPEGMSEAEYCRSIVCLWEFCETCAKGFRADFRNSEVKDLASDYMRLIKSEPRFRPCPVPRSMSALKNHMKHVLSEELNTAGKELWQLLSEAFWALEREGTAMCLGGTRRGVRADQRNNTPFTQWVGANVFNAHNGKPPPADVFIFEKKADSLPHFYPPGGKGWHPSAPRVIAPKGAEKLATMLLDCADGWIVLRDVFHEFRKHVHMLEILTPPPDDEENTALDQQAEKRKSRKSELGPRHAFTEDAFWELVSKLAAKAWEALCAADLTTIACQYVLANALLGRKRRLEEFGDFQRVSERKAKVQEILRRVLLADELLDAEGEISDWHDKLWSEVLRCLTHSVEFCNFEPEKPDSGALR